MSADGGRGNEESPWVEGLIALLYRRAGRWRVLPLIAAFLPRHLLRGLQLLNTRGVACRASAH